MIKPNYSKQWGLTLIELIFVIALISILITSAAPSFQKTMERQQIISAAEAIQSDLRWARSEAIKRNTNVSIRFTDSALDPWQYDITPFEKTVKSADTSSFQVVTLRQNFASDTLTINPIRGTSNAGSITLTSNHYTIKVISSILGRVRLCADISSYRAC